MTEAPTPQPTAAQDDPAAWAQAALRRQCELLEQLSEAGLRLALTIEGQATADPASAPPKTVSAFVRVAKAVRMTALLQSRLIKDMEQIRSNDRIFGARGRAKAEADAAEAEARLDPAHDHKARVENIVLRVAKTRTDDEDQLDRLVAETADRLDDDDIYGDVLTRPVGELVALICRDLGLDPDWERLSQEAWALEEIASGAPGSPFTRPLPPAGEGDHEVVERALRATDVERACERRPSPSSAPSAYAERSHPRNWASG
jgi:hypothetical protein